MKSMKKDETEERKPIYIVEESKDDGKLDRYFQVGEIIGRFEKKGFSLKETTYIKSNDIEMFKRLSGLEDFKLDRNATRLHTSAHGDIRNNLTVREADPDGNMPPHHSCSSSWETRYKDDSSEL